MEDNVGIWDDVFLLGNMVHCYKVRSYEELYKIIQQNNWGANYCDLTEGYQGLILGLRTAYERHRYKVTPSLIGRAQT